MRTRFKCNRTPGNGIELRRYHQCPRKQVRASIACTGEDLAKLILAIARGLTPISPKRGANTRAKPNSEKQTIPL